jgi:hypothetical protein
VASWEHAAINIVVYGTVFISMAGKGISPQNMGLYGTVPPF